MYSKSLCGSDAFINEYYRSGPAASPKSKSNSLSLHLCVHGRNSLTQV
jgi:hypothetical protein